MMHELQDLLNQRNILKHLPHIKICQFLKFYFDYIFFSDGFLKKSIEQLVVTAKLSGPILDKIDK